MSFSVGWHYLSNATCLIRPRSFYHVCFVASGIVMLGYIIIITYITIYYYDCFIVINHCTISSIVIIIINKTTLFATLEENLLWTSSVRQVVPGRRVRGGIL